MALAARLLLAIVFAAAGITKLADRAGSTSAIREFGVPDRLAWPLALLLPAAECVVAVALLPATSARWAAAAAVALLLAFMAATVRNLVRGRKPDCHCFGRLSRTPAGWPVLLRNGALAAIAALLAAAPGGLRGPSASAWLSRLSPAMTLWLATTLVIAAVVVITWFLGFQLLRQQGRLLLRIETLEQRPDVRPLEAAPGRASPAGRGLQRGARAPAFTLPSVGGRQVSLDDLLSDGNPVLLAFTDPGCGACDALLPEIATWQAEMRSLLLVVPISGRGAAVDRTRMKKLGLDPILIQQDSEVAELFGARGMPSATLISPAGTIATPLVFGADAIRRLVESQRRPSPSGDSLSHVDLTDLNGRTVKLSDREQLVLLFWNPECGFCKRMVSDLRRWETGHSARAADLVLISTGTREANLAMALQSPIILDPSLQLMRHFGAAGTPTAVAVEPKSMATLETAIGSTAVLQLLEHDRPVALRLAEAGGEAR